MFDAAVQRPFRKLERALEIRSAHGGGDLAKDCGCIGQVVRAVGEKEEAAAP